MPFTFAALPRLRRLAVVIISCALLSGGAQANDDDSVIEEILDDGVIRVGLSSFTPWAMRASNGEMIGFEVDVVNKIAEDMGVRAEIIPTAWDGIIPALLAKKFDVIISGMYITPQRNLQVNFTVPYEESGLDLVASRKLVTADMDDIADFNRADITFALRRGAFPVKYVKQNLPKAKIAQFDDDASARQEVLNGRAHAWVTAAPQPRFAAVDYPEQLFQPITGLLTANHQGMALRKGDIDALNFFNNWIAVNKRSGWLQQRYDYWFGGDREWAVLVGK